MQPFMKNVAVEYAAKALPDSELAKALKDLQDGKTTIEEVTALIEGGTVSNAKPLYIHPIIIVLGVGAVLSCFIFNNSSTPFTPETFADYIESVYQLVGDVVRFPCSGTYMHNTELTVATFIARNSSSGFLVYGTGVSNHIDSVYAFGTKENFISAINGIFDGVNKIN